MRPTRTALRCTLLASLVLLATACTKTSDDAATSAAEAAASPAASAAASPAASDTATASAASDAASPASPAAAPAAPAAAPEATTSNIPPPKGMPPGPAPVLDTDYTVIDAPESLSGDKVQVTEVFGFGCPHCNALQPHLAEWEKKLPSDVQFQYLPAAFGNDPAHCWDDFARGYYAATAMGFEAKNHDAVYKAVWDENRLNAGCTAIPGIFAKVGGVDEKTFAATMQSFAVTAKVSAAHEQVVRWAVNSTPTLVIDGKYRVIELGTTGPDGMLHTVDWLIAKERQDHAKH